MMLVFGDGAACGLAEPSLKQISDCERWAAAGERLPKAVIEAAWVYAIDLACEVPPSKII